MGKRIISAFLAAVMLFGMIPPVAVRAGETEVTEAVLTEETAVGTETAVPETSAAAEPETEPVPQETGEEDMFSGEAVPASATEGTCGENLTWTLENGVLTVSGEGEMADYEYYGPYAPWYDVRDQITAVIVEEGVESIGDVAFSGCGSLESVSIADSVTRIGSYAFENCTGLTEIRIPDSVTDLGYSGTFMGCSSLTSVSLPEGLTGIGGNAFSGCSSLTGVTLPAGLTDLGYNGTFMNCSSLTGISIPDGVTGIGDYTFYGCSSLRSVDMPDSAADIGSYAFANCTALADIQIPDGVAGIGSHAFYYCESLTGIHIPDAVTEIERNAFSGCISLTEVSNADGVTSIGKYAFNYCPELVRVDLPEGLVSIGEEAFSACYALTELEIPGTVTSIGFAAFRDCSSLPYAVIPEGVTEIEGCLFDNCSSLASVTIPESVTTIGANAFYGCSSLKTAVIPSGVTAIPDNIFHGCEQLVSVGIPDSVTSIGEAAFSGCSSLQSVSIPDGVSAIEPYTFNGCRNLVSVEIPDSVTSIGSSAFQYCESLADIALPEGIAGIEAYTFYYCKGLTGITIPESVTSIGSSAFEGCSGLTALELPEQVTDIGSGAFRKCENLTTIGIPQGVNAIREGTFYGCTNLSRISLPDSVTGIGNEAFTDCSSLETLELPENLTGIGNGAFSRCFGLTDIVIPKGVTEIPEEAFYNCRNLTRLELPEGLTDIGSYAFTYCEKLQEVHFPDSVAGIGEYAFRYCSSLRTLVIPDGVTRIEQLAFGNCTALTSVEIPSGVTTIGYSAFYECSGLTSVVIPSSVTTIEQNAFEGCTALTDIYYTGSEEAWTALLETLPYGNTPLKEAETVHYNWDDGGNPGGTCGDNLTWSVKDGTLTISVADPTVASYAMNDYLPAAAPWKDCTVTAVVVEQPVTTIGSNAFFGLADLKSVELAGSLMSIGEYAFSGCSSLTSVKIPSRVTSIGRNAFYLCTNLVTANLSANITAIPASLFAGCTSLQTVSIPQGVTSIGEGAFFNCASLPFISIPEGVTVIEANTFDQCASLDNVIFPEGVAAIGLMAFRGCTSLSYLCLPVSLAGVASDAFSGCTALQYVEYRGTQAQWTTLLQSGVANDNGGNDPLVKVADVRFLGSDETDPTDPSAPSVPTDPTEVTTPEEQPPLPGEIIAEGTCGENASWTLSGTGHLNITGTGAVSNSPWLEDHTAQIMEVTVAEGITSLCERAFLNCAGLKKVTAPSSLSDFGASVFYGCTGITSAGPIGSGADYAFGWTEAIPDNAFQHLIYLNKITWPEGLAEIGDNAFQQNAFSKLIIPDGVKQIGRNAFADSLYLKRLSLPQNLTCIGANAFANCTKLTDVFIMCKSVTISENAFQNCTSVKHLLYAVPEEKIGNINFAQGNESLKNAQCIHYAWADIYQTRVVVKRYGEWHDLLEESHVFCLNNSESPDICIVPGMEDRFDSAAGFRLEQNGLYVLRNKQGIFRDVDYKNIFTKEGFIYVAILGNNGDIIYREKLNAQVKDWFTVTLIYWDLKNDESKIDTWDICTYDELDFIPEPRAEEYPLSGYRFCGWYTSARYEGADFFDEVNYVNRVKLMRDITLYAKWTPTDIDVDKDIWQFTNSPNWFDGNWSWSDPEKITAKYEITDGDFNKLIESTGEDEDGISKIKKRRKKTWDGSCFGMSSVVVLSKDGSLQIRNFPGEENTRYATVYEAVISRNTGTTPGNIESLINFYHLRQYATRINTPLWKFSRSDEISNIQNIVRKMSDVNAPVVLTIDIVKKDDTYSSHSVVAYDFEKTGSGYTFMVYDCAVSGDPTFLVEVEKTGSVYFARCPEWEEYYQLRDSDFKEIYFGSALSAEDLKKLPLLEKPETLSHTVSSAGSITSDSYYLETSYDSFTISNGTSSATVSGSQIISGDLSITSHGLIGIPGAYRFELPVLADGEYYTITQNGSGTLETTVQYSDSQRGFFIAQEAEASGIIQIGADGSIATQYDQAVVQTLDVTHNSRTTPWYIVSVEGTSSGLAMIPSAETVEVYAKEETSVNITAGTAFNETTIFDVPVGNEMVLVEEGENVSCIVTKDGKTVASDTFGYSVVFDSQYGSSVDTLVNVSANSLIPEPAAPTKAGYLFEGWFKDQDYSGKWDFAVDTVTSDLVLYAGWSVDPDYMKSVTFRVPGAEDQIIYLRVNSLIPADYAPVDDNGEALTWYTDRAYTYPWDFTSDILSDDLILYGATAQCTVAFEANNGQTLEAVQLYAGMPVPRPEGIFTENHTLCGWYTDESFHEEWNFERDTVSESMTLYARWLPNEIDIQGNDTGICVEILNEDGYIYTGKAIKPEIIVRDAGRVLIPGTDYTVSYKNNTNARSTLDTTVRASGLPQIIIQGKGNYKSSKKITKYFTIHQADMQDLQVSLPAFVTCKTNNKLQTVKASVSTGLAKVAAGNYTIAYCTDPELTQSVRGITAPGVYYVTLEAKQDSSGNYSGNFRGVTDAFVIEAAPGKQMISSAKITLAKTITAAEEKPGENAAIQALITKVVLNKVTYPVDDAGIDGFKELFVVTARDADGTEVAQHDLGTILMSAGKKTLIVSAREGNPLGLVGEKTATVSVRGTALKKAQFHVTFDETGDTTITKREYSGTAQVPTVLSQLEEDTDYTVSYRRGKNTLSLGQIRDAGSYSLVITGKGCYSGSLTYSFTITKADIAGAYAAGRVRITSSGSAVYSPLGAKLHPSVSYINEEGARIAMTEGSDYTLSWSGHKTVTETASMTLKGRGNFSGTLNRSKAPELVYAVARKPLSASDISVTVTGLTVKKGDITGAKYTVYHSGKKVSSRQYTGELTDDGADTVTLTITGEDKLYTGSRSLEIRKDLIKATDTKKVRITLAKENRYYTGSRICPEVAITDGEGRDISHCFTITYGENIKTGSGSITVTGRPELGYYGTKTVKFTILPRWTRWLFG